MSNLKRFLSRPHTRRNILGALLVALFCAPALVMAMPEPPGGNGAAQPRTTPWPRYFGETEMTIPFYGNEGEFAIQNFLPTSGEAKVSIYNRTGGWLGTLDIDEIHPGESFALPHGGGHLEIECESGDSGAVTFARR